MLLLDTNALLWLSGGSERLGPSARLAIEAAIGDGAAAFSAISVWEVAMLVRKNRYTLSLPVDVWRSDLLAAGLAEAPLDGLAAGMAGGLAALHEDPADRFIAATALRLGAGLVTSDQRLIAWANLAGTAPPIDARV